MITSKKQALKQGSIIYALSFIPATAMVVAVSNPEYFISVPGLIGTAVCYLQGVFSPFVRQESRYVSTQQGAVR